MAIVSERPRAQIKPSGADASTNHFVGERGTQHVPKDFKLGPTQLESRKNHIAPVWVDGDSDTNLVPQVLELRGKKHTVFVLRNVSSPFPRREVMRELQKLNVPLLALPDHITASTPTESLKIALRKAWGKFMQGRTAGLNSSAAERLQAAPKPRFKVGRGPLSDEERKTFKDAFLGAHQFDDGIR